MNGTDPTAINGKQFAIERHWPLVVVGGGASGAAAAIAAARAGNQVLLVDEHPAAPGLLGMDVPYLFGGRLDASVQNSARIVETVLGARPFLEQAADAGVELALGVSVWGAFARGPASRNLSAPLLGLADEARAWLVSADSIVVAAGTRDVGSPFPGWDLLGVMGARGFLAALDLYRAFNGRRIAVLGRGAAADSVLRAAAAHGIELAIHQAEPVAIRALGTHEVQGIAIDGRETACDTIVVAIDAVPNIELLDLLGVPASFDAWRGGFIPAAFPGFVSAVGACTGRVEPEDRFARRAAWLEAMATADSLVCRCEDVTLSDLLQLRPPRYLGDARHRPLHALGPLNQDQVKRLTRAGMGACQGRRCRDAVHALLARDHVGEGGRPPMASFRPPLRPLPLAALAALPEPAEIRADWTGWFGIASQWLPHWQPAPDDASFVGNALGTPWDAGTDEVGAK
jgi:hypothetical protein